MFGDLWNELVARFSGAHVLQTWQWGEVKNRYAWKPLHLVWDGQGAVHELTGSSSMDIRSIDLRAMALVLERSIQIPFFPVKLKIMYVPKGPLLDWTDDWLRRTVLSDLVVLARRRSSIFLKIDPDVCQGRGIPGSPDDRADLTGRAAIADLNNIGWLISPEQIQFRNTVVVDLDRSLDDILAQMKQKTRYNIRLAERKGVNIRSGSRDDFPILYDMYAETSLRDGFAIRDRAYYQFVWGSFSQAGMAESLIAEYGSQVVAAIILFYFANKAWYFYGMSSEFHREKMPNYLLQWQAMNNAKAKGCMVYDLWGAPDMFDESDAMWGVYRFKEGLGGKVVRNIGAWDFIVHPRWYWIYSQVIPMVLSRMRRRGQEQTRQIMQV